MLPRILKRASFALPHFLFCTLLFLKPTLVLATNSPLDPVRLLPIQDAGRIKPFDTFARESLQMVYGREEWKPIENKERSSIPAVEVVFTWFLTPEHWDQQPLISIPTKALREALKLDTGRTHFSPREIFLTPRLGLVMQELNSFRETKQKLNAYFQSVQRLESALALYEAVKRGQAVRVVPPKPGAANSPGAETDRWLSLPELPPELREKFTAIVQSYVRAVASDPTKEQAGPSVAEATRDFIAAARASNPAAYASDFDMKLESHYKSFQPFQWSWILYLIAALAGSVYLVTRDQPLSTAVAQASRRTAVTATVLAFLMHTYGFGLRVYITGRPPVSNMYETVIWVSWGAVLFSSFFEWRMRRGYMLLVGNIVAVLCLIAANLAPTVLDASLQPLEPVLRSNLWLTIHVLTIAISYSAFFLAWALGNFGLLTLLRGKTAQSQEAKDLALGLYRCIQVGVALLAPGIILGGVWADYSWGRFWGWDPKETWALIALLGYLAILHGRLIGLVKTVGLFATAVVGFNLVIMAWYGVNFVLGAGLHSYGFGAGGVEYVASAVAVNLAFVVYAVIYIRSRDERAAAS